MKPVIAVDGHAGSGKGTISKKVARHFGFAYLDTGLFYRMIAFSNMDEEALSLENAHDFVEKISQIPASVLRSEEVSARASSIAKSQKIREKITKFIREFAENPGDQFAGSVIDGRDIGTTVLPEAECKLFFTADVLVRARRRFRTLRKSNPNLSLAEIHKNLENRDKQDSSREHAPLTFNEEYILIDTSSEPVRKTFKKVLKITKTILFEKIHSIVTTRKL